MRYSRQILFEGMGLTGQEKLSSSHVVIVGCGATGSVAADMLARSGIGKITIIDRDIIELSNLQRQVLFTESNLGEAKASVAENVLRSVNSDIVVSGIVADLDSDNVDLLCSDLVLDCTDNLHTRFLVNEYCRKNNIPAVFCSVIGSKGMVFPLMPGNNPCFRCIFREAEGLETCETSGILNTAPHAIVSLQVTYALKILTGTSFNPCLIHFDLWDLEFSKLSVKNNASCPVCSGSFEYLEGRGKPFIKLCGSENYQVKGDFDFDLVKSRLKKSGNMVDRGDFFVYGDITVFKGRVIIKASSESEARKVYSRLIGD